MVEEAQNFGREGEANQMTDNANYNRCANSAEQKMEAYRQAQYELLAAAGVSEADQDAFDDWEGLDRFIRPPKPR